MSASVAAHAHVLVELDNYATLREALGEETASLVLDEYLTRLQRIKRRGDGLIRIAANQYCLVLRDVQQQQHVGLAMAKLYRQFAKPCELFGESVPLVLHAGVALPGERANTAKQMLARAAAALQLAKAQQQPHVVFDDEHADENRKDPAALLRLQEALEQGEFVVYYQPKVSAAYSSLVGAEALLRWHDPRRKKVIAPSSFIELIEDSGLVMPLTLHVIKTAISRCAQWPDPLSVAVNVPPKLLEGATLVTSIADALAIAELPAERFTVEVTERGQLPASALAVLRQLNGLGVKIAIDDFGTGQASLLQFRDMPAHIVKIDQAFVRPALDSAKNRAIIRGMVDLAHHCKMQVVAEGVESAEIAELMQSLGCDWLQGYWFGKPLPHAEFASEHLSQLAKPTDLDHAAAILGG